jgi:hypothetical protein
LPISEDSALLWGERDSYWTLTTIVSASCKEAC